MQALTFKLLLCICELLLCSSLILYYRAGKLFKMIAFKPQPSPCFGTHTGRFLFTHSEQIDRRLLCCSVGGEVSEEEAG
ncbi:hypothetical protein XELAEV_18026719mg [Xenopus laevis]|uniref:Uncharacterized protein n=1 Tax=Xenopus laevis TaxID=8355 RepID=A0A974HJ03_XENLA|nr:hypothetical protein XELAEV_18026719mg [Xenopus laevis]